MSRYLQAYFTLREHFPETEFTTREARLVLSELSDAHVWKILNTLVKRKYIKRVKHAVYEISPIEDIVQEDKFKPKNKVRTLLEVFFHPKVIITGVLAAQFLTNIVHTSNQIDLLVEQSSLTEIKELLIPSTKVLDENTFELFSKRQIKVVVVITSVENIDERDYLLLPLFNKPIKISKPEHLTDHLIDKRRYRDISFLIARNLVNKSFVYKKYPEIKEDIEYDLNNGYFQDHYLNTRSSNEQIFEMNLCLAWEEIEDYEAAVIQFLT